MNTRNIVSIDEDLCNGCGECIPNCHEGALQIIDGKARLVSDLFCDGLGACIGHCPLGAMSIERREAEPYDERRVMENMINKGINTVRAHLIHLKEHGALDLFNNGIEYLLEKGLDVPDGVLEESCEDEIMKETGSEGTLACGCPGSQVQTIPDHRQGSEKHYDKRSSHLSNWPIQLMLVPVNAPFLKDSDIVMAADCVPFAYPDFHEDFLKGKVLLNACPKLDSAEHYVRKLTEVFKTNCVRSISILHMEVPCCFGLVDIVKTAVRASGKDISMEDVTITVRGEIKNSTGTTS